MRWEKPETSLAKYSAEINEYAVPTRQYSRPYCMWAEYENLGNDLRSEGKYDEFWHQAATTFEIIGKSNKHCLVTHCMSNLLE